MSGLRSALLVPLLVVALLAAVLGFLVTRQLAPTTSEGAKVSVISLPSSPTPEPTAEPTATATPEPDEEDGGGRGSSSSSRGGGDGTGGGSGSCPAGCTCESRPPSGVVIVCRGS